jgi:hypothetical protein
MCSPETKPTTKEVIMKILLSSVLMLFAGVTFACAADVYTYEGMGTVTFNHKEHMSLGCASCHEGKPERIVIENKEQGHANCLECHKEQGGSAPTKCNECHIR